MGAVRGQPSQRTQGIAGTRAKTGARPAHRGVQCCHRIHIVGTRENGEDECPVPPGQYRLRILDRSDTGVSPQYVPRIVVAWLARSCRIRHTDENHGPSAGAAQVGVPLQPNAHSTGMLGIYGCFGNAALGRCYSDIMCSGSLNAQPPDDPRSRQTIDGYCTQGIRSRYGLVVYVLLGCLSTGILRIPALNVRMKGDRVRLLQQGEAHKEGIRVDVGAHPIILAVHMLNNTRTKKHCVAQDSGQQRYFERCRIDRLSRGRVHALRDGIRNRLSR